MQHRDRAGNEQRSRGEGLQFKPVRDPTNERRLLFRVSAAGVLQFRSREGGLIYINIYDYLTSEPDR